MQSTQILDAQPPLCNLPFCPYPGCRTRAKIRRLKPGGRITEHGITAECLKDGDIRYTVNIMVDGERIHRVIGRASEGTTRTQAEDFIEKARIASSR